MAVRPDLIYCAGGNPSFARAAVEAGWLYGARLPCTVYQEVFFADQDWKHPDRGGYMASLAGHLPARAVVIDWEGDDQLPEVLSWAEEAASRVTESVVIVPKVPGRVGDLPRSVGGRRVVLGYSVPTSYGGSPLGLWEFSGWPVHLLGGSPQKQLDLFRYLRLNCEVTGLDGNMAAQQARKCRVWQARPWGPRSLRWVQLSDLGDDRPLAALECFRLSLDAISGAWDRAAS